LAGTTASYTITIANSGPNRARRVVAQDLIPRGTTLVAAKPSQGRCPAPPKRVKGRPVVFGCKLGAIAKGGKATVTLELSVGDALTGLIDRARVTSLAPNLSDPNVANNAAAAATPVKPRQADLSLKMSAPATISHAQLINYTLIVANAGPYSADHVEVVERLPSGVAFLGTTSTLGRCGRPSKAAPGMIVCRLGTVTRQAVRIVVGAKVQASGGSLSGTATVRSPDFDPKPADNTATAVTALVSAAGKRIAPAAKTDVAVRILTNGPYGPLGGDLTYFVSAGNGGPGTATGVHLADWLPDGTTFVSAHVPGGTCATPSVGAGGVVDCALPPLQKYHSSVLTLVVKVRGTPDPGHPGQYLSLQDTATVFDPPNLFDPAPSNNSETLTNPVETPTIVVGNLSTTQISTPPLVVSNLNFPVADLTMHETDSGGDSNGGGIHDLVFSVTNKGPDTATGVVATITFAEPGNTLLTVAQPGLGTITQTGTSNPDAPAQFTWDIGDLPSGSTLAVESMFVQVDPATVLKHLMPLPAMDMLLVPPNQIPPVTGTGDSSVASILNGNLPPSTVSATLAAKTWPPPIAGMMASVTSASTVDPNPADDTVFTTPPEQFASVTIVQQVQSVTHCTKNWGFGALIMGDSCATTAVAQITADVGAAGAAAAGGEAAPLVANSVSDAMEWAAFCAELLLFW
jgi:uncharacterized repeat protein (TIGR01451 family)